MEILKIAGVGLTGAICFVILKAQGSELASLSLIATGAILLIGVSGYVLTTVNFFKQLADGTGINPSLFVTVVKITVISYLMEISVSLCEDMGVKSIGSKIAFAGRIVIFTTAIPVFKELVEVATSLLK